MTKRLDTRLMIAADKLGQKKSPVFAVAWFCRNEYNLESIAHQLGTTPQLLRPIYEAVKTAFDEEEFAVKKGREKRAPARAAKGKPHKCPADWQPSEPDVAYAKERGFDDSQIREIRNGFVGYWVERGEERTGWSLTWQRWIRTEKERQDKIAQPTATSEARSGPSREQWIAAVQEWLRTGDWPAALGPPPGAAGCRAPRDLVGGKAA